jgi:predicted nucleic acid-binding protein
MADYEAAAEMSNLCRSRGIQGSNTDFLICAVAKRLGASVYTLDRDFELFSSELAVTLHSG